MLIGEPTSESSVFIGDALRFKVAFNPVLQALRLVRDLNHDKRVYIRSSLQEGGTKVALLCKSAVEQKRRLVVGRHRLREVLVDNQHLFDKTCRNDFFFGDFDDLRLGYPFRCCRAADNLLSVEILYNLVRLDGVVLMALVNDDDEMQAARQGVCDMFKEIGAFTIFERVVSFLRQLLPIYENAVVFLKTARHNVG